MPISGNTKAKSDKADKQKANRKLRVAMRGAVARDDEALPTLRQVSTENTFEGRETLARSGEVSRHATQVAGRMITSPAA
jgi:hypothetical protein